jgi:hypothetical protein
MKGEICKIEGCQNILKKQDGHICQAHRSRYMRHKTYDLSPNWPNLKKGLPSITKLGYVRINVDGKRILQHRHVMEQYIGRKLHKDERVHHINSNRTDNRIENLQLYKNNGDHIREHHPAIWKLRKKNGEYSAEIIKNILDTIAQAPNPSQNCFCGKPFFAKNLCSKHYQWAYKHKF